MPNAPPTERQAARRTSRQLETVLLDLRQQRRSGHQHWLLQMTQAGLWIRVPAAANCPLLRSASRDSGQRSQTMTFCCCRQALLTVYSNQMSHMPGLNEICPRSKNKQSLRTAFKECKQMWERNRNRLVSWFPDNIIDDCHGIVPQKQPQECHSRQELRL